MKTTKRTKAGKNNNCFFIFPTIVITDYRKDNWISEIKTNLL